MRLLLEELREIGISKGKLLDVGCGYGWLLKEADSQGFEVFGVEPTQLYKRLKQRFGHRIVQGFFPSASFPGEAFDVVAAIDVIEHIPIGVLPSFLVGVRDTLRAGGIFMVKVPDSSGLIFQASAWAHRLTYGLLRSPVNRMLQLDFEFPHESYFRQSNLTHYLNSFGFEVVKVMHHPEISPKTAWNRIKYQHNSSVVARLGYTVALTCLWGISQVIHKKDALILFAKVQE